MPEPAQTSIKVEDIQKFSFHSEGSGSDPLSLLLKRKKIKLKVEKQVKTIVLNYDTSLPSMTKVEDEDMWCFQCKKQKASHPAVSWDS